MVAPDEKTFDYVRGRPKAPKGGAWENAMRYWETLHSDEGAAFDTEIRLDAAKLPPIVTWGTNPGQVVSVAGRVPTLEQTEEHQREALTRALAYMDLKGGEKITDIAVNRVFIGSCTNGRIEDLRAAAKIAAGKSVNANVNAMIVPGSGLVKEHEAEGLDKIFKAAGFDWREPGCSMSCDESDKLAPASAAPRPRTAISRAVRATRAAPISSRSRWPLPRSRVTSSTSATGTDEDARSSYSGRHSL